MAIRARKFLASAVGGYRLLFILLIIFVAIIWVATSSNVRHIKIWQTYCAQDYEHEWEENMEEPTVVATIRPSEISRTIHLFPREGLLYAWDTANGDQFTVSENDNGISGVKTVKCLKFEDN